jgi:hypothetical protein
VAPRERERVWVNREPGAVHLYTSTPGVVKFAMEDYRTSFPTYIPNSTSRYAFNRERVAHLSTYALIKMKTRVTKSNMDDFVTHSDARRWSYGYKLFIR